MSEWLLQILQSSAYFAALFVMSFLCTCNCNYHHYIWRGCDRVL